jgi:hypothetical protein
MRVFSLAAAVLAVAQAAYGVVLPQQQQSQELQKRAPARAASLQNVPGPESVAGNGLLTGGTPNVSSDFGSGLDSVLNSTDSILQSPDDVQPLSSSKGGLPLGLRFLYQNDMDWTRAADPSKRQPAYIMLTQPSTYTAATTSCKALNESLLTSTAAVQGTGADGLASQLSFLQYEGSLKSGTKFWASGRKRLQWDGKKLKVLSSKGSGSGKLRALCTQSAPYSNVDGTDNSDQWAVQTKIGNLTFQG